MESKRQIQQDSEDEIQQEVEETATTDFLGRWWIEAENKYIDSLLHGYLVGGYLRRELSMGQGFSFITVDLN
jgi:hypothetical protein